MARIRIVYDKGVRVAEYHNGELVYSAQVDDKREAGYYVMPDIQPYQSMADGTMIQGRRQHREHLRQHGLIEVGNEVKHLKSYGDYKPKGVKEDLIREYQQHKERHRG